MPVLNMVSEVLESCGAIVVSTNTLLEWLLRIVVRGVEVLKQSLNSMNRE